MLRAITRDARHLNSAIRHLNLHIISIKKKSKIHKNKEKGRYDAEILKTKRVQCKKKEYATRINFRAYLYFL